MQCPELLEICMVLCLKRGIHYDPNLLHLTQVLSLVKICSMKQTITGSVKALAGGELTVNAAQDEPYVELRRHQIS